MKEHKSQLLDVIEPYAGRAEELIQVLHRVQENLGHVPYDVQRLVAETLGVPLSRVYGVVTFYHLFRIQPVGKHTIRLCQGTACHVRGAEDVLRALRGELEVEVGDTSADGLFTLEIVRCLGTCGLAPVMMVDEIVHGRLTTETVRELIQTYRANDKGERFF